MKAPPDVNRLQLGGCVEQQCYRAGSGQASGVPQAHWLGAVHRASKYLKVDAGGRRTQRAHHVKTWAYGLGQARGACSLYTQSPSSDCAVLLTAI